jgi:tetratricopeptide (TPR) repeat protein
MNKFRAFLVVMFFVSFNSFACLNGETKILKNGAYVYIDYRGLVPHGHHFLSREFPQIIKQLDSLYRKTNDIDYLSDKGYILIVQKKYDEALELYLNIEKIKPNRYSTASNIGTLYELIGENQKAYEWIKKSIQINPESHNGSEWLHLNILQAKIKKIDDAHLGEFLINNSFGKDVIPKIDLPKETLKELAKSIYYQANERMSFIKPKDKIISALLFELGNAVKIIGENENAIRIYNLAKEYGFQDELVNQRIIYCYQSKNKYVEKENQKLYENITKVKRSKQGVDVDYVGQIESVLVILSIVAALLLIVSIILYLKWKNLRDYILLNDFSK